MGERLPHHRRNIEGCPGGGTYPTFRGISARISQWIIRAAPVGYEEFYVLLERSLFNPAPVEHTHIYQPAVTRISPKIARNEPLRPSAGGGYGLVSGKPASIHPRVMRSVR
jgi:hypothetical protein